MGNLSKTRDGHSIPVKIEVTRQILDHKVSGKAVLPAVAAMEAMAGAVKKVMPDIEVNHIHDASFQKFLLLKDEADIIDAFVETQLIDGANNSRQIQATFCTRFESQKSNIKRTLRHVTATFGRGKIFKPHPIDIAASLEGKGFAVDALKLYRELVPFGASFQNIRGSLYMTMEGAFGTATGGPIFNGGSEDAVLGSPFTSDASFHGACVWGQRYAGLTAYPAGMGQRIIHARTKPGEKYIFRVFPKRVFDFSLEFDINIYKQSGELAEEIRGLMLEDFTKGMTKPPPWILEEDEDNKSLSLLRDRVTDMTIVELVGVSGLGKYCLAPREQERFDRMKEKRGTSFLAARMAVKRLSRKLSGNYYNTSPEQIETVAPDMEKPQCPNLTDGGNFICSVSHDKRFAIAVTAEAPIGVDVEQVSDRIHGTQKYFMHQNERTLASESAMGSIQASLRIWSIKESVSKAFGSGLTDAWKRTEVTQVGLASSRITIDGQPHSAFHGTIEDHIFTIVKLQMGTVP